MQRQTTFGWLIGADLFLAGAGSGLFLVSFVMNAVGKYEPIATIGSAFGPVLALMGTFILFADLGNKPNFLRLFHNRSSWMARGTWFIGAFIVFGLAYSVPLFWIPWSKTPVGSIVGAIAAACALFVIMYAGFLFGAAKRVPFWNTSALPLTFLLSSLYSGLAIFLALAFAGSGALKEDPSPLVIAESILLLLQLVVLAILVETANRGNQAVVQSVSLVRRPLLTRVIILGLVIPLALLSFSMAASDKGVPLIAACLLVLVGSLFLRHTILEAGVRVEISIFPSR